MIKTFVIEGAGSYSDLYFGHVDLDVDHFGFVAGRSRGRRRRRFHCPRSSDPKMEDKIHYPRISIDYPYMIQSTKYRQPEIGVVKIIDQLNSSAMKC